MSSFTNFNFVLSFLLTLYFLFSSFPTRRTLKLNPFIYKLFSIFLMFFVVCRVLCGIYKSSYNISDFRCFSPNTTFNFIQNILTCFHWILNFWDNSVFHFLPFSTSKMVFNFLVVCILYDAQTFPEFWVLTLLICLLYPIGNFCPSSN
jgi:hypothetical protein